MGESGGLPLMEVVLRTTRHLRARGVTSPRLEAELIVARALDLARLDLYLQFDRPMAEEELARIRPLLAARASGRPLAQVVGEREFFGLGFAVGERALIPRPESELVVEVALGLREPPARAADLGCGTGCLGVALAVRLPALRVDLVEVDPELRGLAAGNAARHGVEGRVEVLCGSWAEPLRGRAPYDLVLANPPYVTTPEWEGLEPGVRDFEPRLALDGGPDGLTAYRQLLPQLPPVLAPGATVLLEGDPRRISEVEGMCAATFPGARLNRHRDLSGRDRVLQVTLP